MCWLMSWRPNEVIALAAHRMTDQRVALQPESMRNSFNIVGHCCKIVASICHNGVAPTALIEHDHAPRLAEPVNNALPCS